MGGKRTQGEAAADGDAAEASRKRLSVDGAAGSTAARSAGQTESESMSVPVTAFFSMWCDAGALAGDSGKAAPRLPPSLETALRKAVTDWGGGGVRMGRVVVGPSTDTLQRVLPLLLERVELEGAAQSSRVCISWRKELVARGFCSPTVQLCSSLAESGDFPRLWKSALQRLDASNW